MRIPKATHIGEINIGNIRIPCAVLEDGTRVLSEHGITNALLGSRSGYSKRRTRQSKKNTGAPLPLFLAPHNLKPFINKELTDGPLSRLEYKQRDRTVSGFRAEILPDVCDVWLQARDAGALQTQQMDKVLKAEMLMRGLAHIGITALIDEATGYQEVRDRKALQDILDRYLLAEHAKWAKRFPDEFYREIFRIRGWQWQGMKVNRPQVVGHYTNDIVWDRLAPGVRKELEKLNPPVKTGSRAAKHHQHLTPDVGHPALQRHLVGVMAVMRGSLKWDQFMRSLQRAYPKINVTTQVPRS